MAKHSWLAKSHQKYRARPTNLRQVAGPVQGVAAAPAIQSSGETHLIGPRHRSAPHPETPAQGKKGGLRGTIHLQALLTSAFNSATTIRAQHHPLDTGCCEQLFRAPSAAPVRGAHKRVHWCPRHQARAPPTCTGAPGIKHAPLPHAPVSQASSTRPSHARHTPPQTCPPGRGPCTVPRPWAPTQTTASAPPMRAEQWDNNCSCAHLLQLLVGQREQGNLVEGGRTGVVHGGGRAAHRHSAQGRGQRGVCVGACMGAIHACCWEWGSMLESGRGQAAHGQAGHRWQAATQGCTLPGWGQPAHVHTNTNNLPHT